MTSETAEFACGPLEPRQEQEIIKNHRFVAVQEGIAWLQLRIEANDKNAVEYYQSESDPIPIEIGEWLLPLYVVSRERLTIIRLLEQLVRGQSR